MIAVRLGRLEDAETEGLLRPVRSDLTGITGASRRIEFGLGEKVRARLEEMGEVPVGGAVVTPGGGLRTPFVIHAVLESPDESVSAFGVRRALVNGLRRAREWEMASLSLPPFGLGAGALEPEDSAHMVIEVLADHLREGSPPAELVIVVESAYEEDLFRRLLTTAEI